MAELNLPRVATHLSHIAEEMAKATSPLDDFEVATLRSVILSELQAASAPAEVAAVPVDKRILEIYDAHAGRETSPERLAFLVKLLEALAPFIKIVLAIA